MDLRRPIIIGSMKRPSRGRKPRLAAVDMVLGYWVKMKMALAGPRIRAQLV
jgi:hypothetical protein